MLTASYRGDVVVMARCERSCLSASPRGFKSTRCGEQQYPLNLTLAQIGPRGAPFGSTATRSVRASPHRFDCSLFQRLI